MLLKLRDFFIGLIFPPHCQACRKALSFSSAEGLCPSCISCIRWIKGPHCVTCGRTLTLTAEGRCELCRHEGITAHFDRAYVCAAYEGPIREILHRYKFNRKTAVERFISKRLIDFAGRHLHPQDFDAVMAVPLDPVRHFFRGFNQSARLSKTVGRSLKLKEISSLAGRKTSRSCQSLLSKKDRASNVRDVFYLKDPSKFGRFKRILLVDDILTSGRTLSECARALKDAGAGSVTALAFARVV